MFNKFQFIEQISVGGGLNENCRNLAELLGEDWGQCCKNLRHCKILLLGTAIGLPQQQMRVAIDIRVELLFAGVQKAPYKIGFWWFGQCRHHQTPVEVF